MDTSAALKLLMAESETAALKGHPAQVPLGTTLVPVDALITYDDEMSAAARRAGLAVVSPS